MSENKYMVDFEFKHIGSDDYIRGSNFVTLEQPIDENNYEHFEAISRELFSRIDGCSELRLLRVVENEPWLEELTQILAGDSVDPE